MQNLMNITKNLLSKRLSRKDYIKYVVFGAFLSLLVGVILPLSLNNSIDASQSFFTFLSLVNGIFIAFIAIVIFILDIRRLRDILPAIHIHEFYVVLSIFFIFRMIIPFVNVIGFFFLVYLRSDFSESEVYKNNVEDKVKGLTYFIKSKLNIIFYK